MNLTVTVTSASPDARIRVAGDLTYGSTAALVDTITSLCDARAAVSGVHLDFADLTFCDSAGLSALLLIHRRASAAGIPLHFHHRPDHLNRILDITGLLDHLTATRAKTPDETGIG
ncbi:STAS domain-containing protein [Mycobacterium sp. SMC-4]|uniref:STAS domain-containing protein n=1 Tax=Mycobacterium sp. SMC-4 TaxID=2857059 RepID=UPI003D046E22